MAVLGGFLLRRFIRHVPKDLVLFPTVSSFLPPRVEREITLGGVGCPDVPADPSMFFSDLTCFCPEEIISLKVSLIAGAVLVSMTASSGSVGEILKINGFD